MKHLLPVLLAVLLCRSSLTGAEDALATAPLEAYAAVGASIVQDNRLAKLGWTEAQVEAFLRGVRQGFGGEAPRVDGAAAALFAAIGHRVQELEQEELRQRYGPEAFARPGYLARYLEETRRQFGLEATDSGLSFGISKAGYGVRPGPDDTVVISYKVTKADTRTDLPALQVDRLKIKVSALLPGLAEGCQMMTVDSLALLVVPPDLSYGAGQWPPGTDPGTPLLFTIKLHEVIAAP
jgi:FKBP-type peptidyl-prolyl cis-trans isomerase